MSRVPVLRVFPYLSRSLIEKLYATSPSATGLGGIFLAIVEADCIFPSGQTAGYVLQKFAIKNIPHSRLSDIPLATTSTLENRVLLH